MKKKIFVCLIALLSLTLLTACGKKNVNLADYIIEDRNTLYTAEDDLYKLSFSSGLREENYSLDGVKGNMIEFGIISFSRLDNDPMANDNYSYRIVINDQEFTGTLEKSETSNSYSTDIGVQAKPDDVITVQVNFTGYTFNKELANTSKGFSVDRNTALDLANNELKDTLAEITKDKNNQFEVIMKILNDYSGEEKHFYWYVGVITTNGETLGVLIDANSGDVISKKV